jgi:YD repeat-containing protein
MERNIMFETPGRVLALIGIALLCVIVITIPASMTTTRSPAAPAPSTPQAPAHAPESAAEASRQLVADNGPLVRQAINAAGYECNDVYSLHQRGVEHEGQIYSAVCRTTGYPLSYRIAVNTRSGMIVKVSPKLAALVAVLASGASAQSSRAFYDASGRRIGSATTDSQGTTTLRDERGRVISRETATGNVTTIYDARSRNVGRFR